MSPIVAVARQRLEQYVQAQQPPGSLPSLIPLKPGMLRQLIDNLVAAVRAEQPSDRPF